MRTTLPPILLLAASLHAQTWFPLRDDAAQKVPFASPRKLYAFPFDRVRLGDGPVHPYLASDSAWLLSLDPDKFLSGYVTQAGLPKTKDNYIATGAATAGHHLSALALFWATTGNPEFKRRADHMVAEFARVQKAIGTGDIGVGDRSNAFWDDVAAGRIDAQKYKFTLNGAAVPWYIYHKALAGLLDAHLWCGNSQALQVARGVGDWIATKFAGLSETQFQAMLECEYGGMEEVLENLHLLTGDSKYRTLGLRFRHKSVMDPVSAGVDNLTHLHANTTLPKYLAAARRAETTSDGREWTASRTSWNSIYDGRTYAMGGTSSWESWQVPPGEFPLIDWGGDKRRGPETCISYNLLKMGMHMLSSDRAPAISHDMEHTFWNHILSAWNPDNHGMLYFTPVYPGEPKGFHARDDWFPCCKSSAMESHARHGAFAWMHDGQDLYLEQFIASTLDWKEKGATITLETRFPESDTLLIRVGAPAPVSFVLRLRKPLWAGTPSLRLNGGAVASTIDGDGRLAVSRRWSGGDMLEVILPRSLRVVAKPDAPGTISVFHGPVLLAALIAPGDTAPSFEGPRERPHDWIAPMPGTQDWWARSTSGAIVTFRPFYRVREERYALYSAHFDGSSVGGVHEAERAHSTATKIHTSSSASGGAYVGGIDTDASRVVFGVNALRAGSATFVVRFANGTESNSTHSVSCGTWTGIVTYPPTGGWAKWDSVRLQVPLALGPNLLAFAKGSGYAELDLIRRELLPWPQELPSTWEAEAASVTRARIDTGVASASGRSVVGGFDWPDSRLVFPEVAAPKRQLCTFRILYSNGTNAVARDRATSGNLSTVVALPPTGGWNRYDSATFQLELAADVQGLSLTRIDGHAQLDALRMIAAGAPPPVAASHGEAGAAIRIRADGRILAPSWMSGGVLEIRDPAGRRLASIPLRTSDGVATGSVPEGVLRDSRILLWTLRTPGARAEGLVVVAGNLR